MLTSLDQLKALTLVPASAGSPPQALPPALAPAVSAGKHFDRALIIVPENQNYSSARTIEDNFGLLPLNSGDGHAKPFTEVWK